MKDYGIYQNHYINLFNLYRLKETTKADDPEKAFKLFCLSVNENNKGILF